MVDALLGRKEYALSEGKRAAEMVPISKDAIHGARVTMNLAVIYAWTDETDRAFQLLEKLAKTPYGLFFNDLKLSHYFDPLRNDPRYDKLLAELTTRLNLAQRPERKGFCVLLKVDRVDSARSDQ